MDYPSNPVIKTFDLIDDQKHHNPSSPLLFRFASLQCLADLNHAVFTRHGGKSHSPFHSLNTSYRVGDPAGQVKSNLELIRKLIGAEQLVFSRQVHGRDILVLDRVVPDQIPAEKEADALITTRPGLGLMIKLADCQGTILFDPEKKVLALVHCGWRGHVKNIYRHVVEKMVKDFGCDPAHIRAAISPSLGPCCAEFKSYRELFPESFRDFMERKNHFNLWELGLGQLAGAGLARKNIHPARVCTRCRKDLFYSYRGEGRTGRFAIVAMLRKNEK